MNKAKQRLLFCFLIVLVPFELNGFYNPWVSKFPQLFWTIDVASWVVIPSINFVIMLKGRLTSIEELGLKVTNSNLRQNGLTIFFSLILIAFFYQGYVTAKSFAYHNWPQNYFAVNFSYVELAANSANIKNLLICYYAITAGVIEEIYYRGVLRCLFPESIGGNISFVLISSLLFSSVHWEQGIRGLFATFVVGFIAATYYVFRKDLWPLIVGHTATWLILYL